MNTIAVQADMKVKHGLDLHVRFKVSYGGMASLLIGEVAERAGVPTPTIRYYESLGLLKPAARSSAGYRRYAEAAVEELRFIKKAQALGFSLDEVGEILKLARGARPISLYRWLPGRCDSRVAPGRFHA